MMVNYVGEVCDVCRAFGETPHVPIAGVSTVSMFNEKLQVDLLFADDIFDSVRWAFSDVLSVITGAVEAA